MGAHGGDPGVQVLVQGPDGRPWVVNLACRFARSKGPTCDRDRWVGDVREFVT